MTQDLKITMTGRKRSKSTAPSTPIYKSFQVTVTQDSDGNDERNVVFHTPKLLEWMREHTSLEDMYDPTPTASTYTLFTMLGHIKHRATRNSDMPLLKELVSFLELEHTDIASRLQNMVAKGSISFNMMKSIFESGSEISIHDGNNITGGCVTDAEYRSGMFGTFLIISYEYMSSNGRTYLRCRDTFKVQSFKGMKDIATLPIRPITTEVKNLLTARGKQYAKVAIGSHFMHYTGHMEVKTWWSWTQMRAEGRIMADTATYYQFESEDDYRERDDTDLTEIPEANLWMTEPYIFGFSFTTKQWGRFLVENIADIKFQDAAFDQLVLADDKKTLIRSLVTNSAAGFTDIISGKGGGCIFLLHGEPGVGKTLTAEAIAELLHRPLYSVSVGELGVNTEDLETNLRKILDVAQIWNAVILIDEADIFLEKRTSGDILRNAMVGIFLRLLEYHQGVLFLTTNRVTEFDTAFHSRISIALKYGKLTQDARVKIWTNLLAAANIKGLDPAMLSTAEINGRQIKNIIRLAQGLASQEGVPVSNAHIETTLDISRQFEIDLLEA